LKGEKEMKKENKGMRGVVKNEITGQTWVTKYYPTYQAAHQAAEKLGRRVSVPANNFYSVIDHEGNTL
jgi:transposase-like protein